MRLSGDHIMSSLINNPTKKEQEECLIKYLGKIPNNYKYIPSKNSVMSVFINKCLNFTGIHTYYEKNAKMKEDRAVREDYFVEGVIYNEKL